MKKFIFILFFFGFTNSYSQIYRHQKDCVERFIVFPNELKYSDTSKFVKKTLLRQEKNNKKLKKCNAWEIMCVIEYYGENRYDTIIKPNLYNKKCYAFYTK